MRPSLRPFWLLQSLVALLLITPVSGHAAHGTTGRWTNKWAPPAVWKYGGNGSAQPAVHMILTRGYGGYHSQILWYNSKKDTAIPGATFLGGVMGWKPDSSAADGDCSTYPTTRFDSLGVANEPASNVFCSAHAALADGRILIAGGTENGEVGIPNSVIFDPATRTFTSTSGQMNQRRWYPTTTTLPDGQVMVSSGSRFEQVHSFGGHDDSGTLVPNNLELLGLTASLEWNGIGKTIGTAAWPAAREAHAACLNTENSEWMLFGGMNANGSYRNDSYMMYQNYDKDNREDYTAVNVGEEPSQPRPTERIHASLAPPDHRVVLFGGLDVNGVKGDTWILNKVVESGIPHWRWSEVTSNLTGDAPPPRQGHTAVWDHENDKILIFGGAGATGTPVDSTLWALTVNADGTGAWSQPTVLPDSASQTYPNMRDGHLLIVDGTVRNSV